MRTLLPLSLALILGAAASTGACADASTSADGGDGGSLPGPPPAPPGVGPDGASPTAADGAADLDAGDSSDASDAANDADAAPEEEPVAGLYVLRYMDGPIAGATVAIGGVEATTDAAGAFSFPAVAEPYALVATYSAAGVDVFDSWAGLTSRSPRIESALGGVGAVQSTVIGGVLSGIANPIPNGTRVNVFARTRYGGVASQVLIAGQSTTFSITPQWYGPPSRSVTVRALAQTTAGSYPTDFIGFAETTVEATHAVNTTADLALTPVSTATVSGTIAPDATGMLMGGMRFGAARSDGAALTFDAPAVTPFALLVPNIRSTPVVAAYRTFPGGGSSFDLLRDVAIGDAHAFVHRGEVTLTAPAAGATFTPGMTLSWTPPSGGGGVYQVRLAASTSAPARLFQHTTSSTSVVVPAAFVPTPGRTYVWQVSYFPRAANVDALVTDDGAIWEARITSAQRTLLVP